MNRSRKLVFALMLSTSMLLPQAGYAARGQDKAAPKPVKAIVPSQLAAPLPPVEKPAEAPSVFPALPPSSPCAPTDLHGLYRLVAVYEDPEGTEVSNFRASPNQYIQFRKENVYARLNVAEGNMGRERVKQEIRKHSSGLLQYLVQDNGFIYFYQNSIAVDVQACFKVATEKAPFKVGQIILMPPKGQIQGRLAKIYESMAAQNAGASPPPQNNKAGGGKRKNKKGKKNL